MEYKNCEYLEPTTLPDPHDFPIGVPRVSSHYENLTNEKQKRAYQAYAYGHKKLRYECILVSLLFLDQVVQSATESTIDPEAKETIED